ncbi:MAG TPA: hypothetical protein VKU82_03815 [Planctomycetaceae bacterium]|nr:hypothetical protein [Planctomycetaceae bacterium]
MTARFSLEAFGRPHHPADRSPPADEEFVPALLPSAGCEVVSTRVFEHADRVSHARPEDDHIFVPEHYEPNYAYPLIVWLRAAERENGGLARLMRSVSERNYFGLSLEPAAGNPIEEQLFEAVAGVRRQYHLHTERVYLIGFGEAGTRAIETGFRQPGWFGGIAAISARWPQSPRLLARYDELRGKRVLLGVNARDGEPLVTNMRHAQKLLWSAGVQVTALTASDDSDRSLLREVDRWMMQSIEQPEFAC